MPVLTSFKESVVSPLFNNSYSIATNKYNLRKENASVRMLKKNRYQESIVCKIFKRITNNHNLSQSQQQAEATDIQEEEIRISMNLRYVKGTGDNYGVHSDLPK